MKAVLLAGGFGTRLSEETEPRPKPMTDIGGRPILWHIMKIYAAHGIRDFVVCLGYRGTVIRQYFTNYLHTTSDATVNLKTGNLVIHSKIEEDWNVTLIDTGLNTQTGGRLKRVADYLGDETFCMTYGDGVSDIDIKALIEHHRSSNLEATVTVVPPPGRFGVAEIEDGRVKNFTEKPMSDGTLINAGFFVLEPKVIDRITSDETIFERSPLEMLARDGQLAAYQHSGFWQPMDTPRDRRVLEDFWNSGNAPWKVW